MGSKQKIARQARREGRKIAQEALGDYRNQLFNHLSVFNKALKPRPKWIPRRVWSWLSGFIINKEEMNKLIK